jgi:hypothetical protein
MPPDQCLSKVRFGVFELDGSVGELRKHGIPIKISPQPFRVLQVLIEKRGQIVTREEIQQILWGANTFVDFARAIPDLSRALLILRTSASGPTVDPKNEDTSKIMALSRLIRIKTVLLRIGLREFWLREHQLTCKEDDMLPYCAFVFPTDLSSLH